MLPNEALYKTDITVPQPAADGTLTNKQLADWNLELVGAIGLANADRASLRAWVNTLTGGKQ